MPRNIRVSDSNLSWLRQNHRIKTYSDMAQHLNCCVDTLKRILVREGLQEFDGAKYQVRRDFQGKTWARPCMKCKDTTERPKNWFFCKSCRKDLGYED